MMLCICVLGLTGCNKQEENSRTLEVAFKKEQKDDFEVFKQDAIKAGGGIITDVDIVENEIFIIAENALLQSMIGDEELEKFFEEMMDDMIDELTNEMGENMNMNFIIEDIEGMTKDYNGKTLITFVLRAPSGDDFYSISVDKFDQTEVFAFIANKLKGQYENIDEKQVVQKLQEREDISTTGFEDGFAIPHAKISGLTEPQLVVLKTNDLNWKALDGKDTNFIISILVPETGAEQHLSILSALTRKLMNDDFRTSLKGSKAISDVKSLISDVEVELKSDESSKGFEYLAITSCPMGVAHTYMAAENLHKAAKKLNKTIKVETQGTVGTEDELTANEIKDAEYIIIAADRTVEMERFYGKKVYLTSTKDAIKNPEELFEKVKKAAVLKTSKQQSEPVSGKQGNPIMKALMNGVSHMLPLVVIGGLFLAIALAFGGTATETGISVADGTIWKSIESIGAAAFGLMVPVLAGYIAYSIGDRSALAPGLVIGWIANNGSFYNSEANAGFLGAIIGGIMVASIMPILIIPLVATFVCSLTFIFFIGAPVALLFTTISTFLASLSGESMLFMGALLGFMIAIDMGGPINKTAMLFAIGMIAAGQPEFMGINGVAVATPSIGIGLATMIAPKLWSEEEKGAGIASAIMGTVGITEGAIPFAAGHPKQVFPATLIGAMVGGMIAAFFKVANVVPHGGFVIALTGGITNVVAFCGAIIADKNGSAALTGLVAWLVITNLLKVDSVSIFSNTDVELVSPAFGKIESQFIGILTGIISAEVYNRTYKIELPVALSFFSGRRLSSILVTVAMVILAPFLYFLWPIIYSILVGFGEWMVGLGSVGAGLFGLFNRLLLPFGLHHALNSVFWFDVANINDINNFLSGEGIPGVTGMYQAGFFPIMMFGLPAAAFAMYREALPKNKAKVGGILLAGAVASLFTGITEPLEFSFMFVAPVLFVLHAVLTGLSLFISASLEWISGFAFSAGILDYVLSFKNPLAINNMFLLLQGIGFAVVYFFSFTFVIRLTNAKTIGRSEDDFDDEEETVSSGNKHTVLAQKIMDILGKDNIISIDNCATRLRLVIKSDLVVDENALKKAGTLGVMRPNKENLQIIVGPTVEFVADELKNLM
ncbi:hypothetical protein GJ496_003992 [Pomphorhynchus laevis]|nr:hypothetical protein GJ496_003992 [Pomphorhynchus laevis]